MRHPLRLVLLLLSLLITSSCAVLNPNTASPTSPPNSFTDTQMASTLTGAYLSINEIGLGANGYVSLTNFTDQPASLNGLYLCQGTNCFSLPDVNVKGGETIRIAVGDGSGLKDVVATHATFGDLRPSDGEIALSTSQNPKALKAMLQYFQWGSDPHELTQTAINDGLWVKGGYGPSSLTATRLYRVPDTGLWLFEEP